MQAECILSWTYFLAKLAYMTRTGHMLGLYVVLHSLFVLICVRTLKAIVFPILTSGQFGGNQNIKGA